MQLLELYRRSTRDYLCPFRSLLSDCFGKENSSSFPPTPAVPLLVSFSEWVIECYYISQGLSLPPPLSTLEEEEEDEDDKMQQEEATSRKTGQSDPLLGIVFSLEVVRDVCGEVLELGGQHLSEVSFSLFLFFSWDGIFDEERECVCETEYKTLERLERL
jgi:hypothetical protein